MVAWLALDGSMAKHEIVEACPFNTPHWQPDYQAICVEGGLAMSATQRFITPQCAAGLMPYQDVSSGCVINADVYLTNREALCELLASDFQTADVILLLRAYLKWGEKCTRYLAGHFGFMIWDPRHQHLFAAVDPFAQCPLFYAHLPGQLFIMTNEYSPFYTLCPQLTVNSRRFVEFAKDVHSASETAYQEIRKLPAGHQLIVTAQALHQTRYWCWKSHRQTLAYQTREQYYVALQQRFEQAVQRCLRRIGPLTTQISGGLDSSAITAQAALLLARQQQTLSAFTSIPNQLIGESYRAGWYYHELPRIKTLLAQHPNIQHIIYTAAPNTDIFEKLKPLQRCFDQPLRNINNLDWTLACYEQVLAQQGRVLLIGAGGNGTISWAGNSIVEDLKAFCVALKAKVLLRRHRWIRNSHEAMLSGRLTAPLRASVYALQLWYGVRRLDPTQELDLSVFCYNVPQWVYRKGKQTLQQRLLTREGLRNLLPEAIAQNPYRGEQGADWYLHYNHYCQRWRDELLTLTPEAQTILWQSYDREKIMGLFDTYPYLSQPPDRKITRDLCLQLLRCLSMGFYLKAFK
jgi:asparagine synthase (glutamine-hydrolysing)